MIAGIVASQVAASVAAVVIEGGLAADGTGATSFMGASIFEGTLSASGLGASVLVGASLVSGQGTLSADGVGASSIMGAAVFTGQLSSDGIGATSFVGASLGWHDSYTTTLNVDSSGWSGFSLRQQFQASVLTTSGSKFRLTLQSSSAGAAVIDGLYAGHQALSGDAYDFDGTQVQVTVSGSPTFTIPSNSTVVTDEISYALDETKNFLVAAHFSTTSAIRGKNSVSGVDSWFKSTTNDTSTADVSGYSANTTGTLRLVSRIEVFS